AWSAGSGGARTGEVVQLPDVTGVEAFRAWLDGARGRILLLGPAEVTCRPMENWERWARPETVERIGVEREEAQAAWMRKLAAIGVEGAELMRMLEEAGIAAILSSRWSEGWSVNKIYSAGSEVIPHL